MEPVSEAWPPRAPGTSSGSAGSADEALRGEAMRLFRRAIDIGRRRRRAFATVFVTVAVAVQLVAFFWPGTYAATAALELQRTRYPAPITADRAAAPTVIASTVSEEEVNSQLAVLTSREVLEPVVREAGLDRIPPRWYMRILLAPIDAYDAAYYWYHDVPPPDAVDRAMRGLRDHVTAERMKDSNVLVVTYQAGDPRFAQAVLDLVLRNYLAHQLAPRRSREAEGFFDEQASRLRDELAGHEDALLALERRAGAGDLAAERGVHVSMDAELRKEDWSLARRAAELDERIATYRATLAGGMGDGQAQTVVARNDAALQLLEKQLLELELERVHLAEHYAPDSPSAVDNRRRIEVARAAIASQQRGRFSQRTTSATPAHLQVEVDLEQALAERAGVAARQRVLAEQLAASRARLEALDAQVLEASRLQRLIDVTADKYAAYLKSGEAARIDAALDAGRFSNASVIQSAAASARPVKPKKLVTLLLALAGGLLAGLGACALLELQGLGLAGVFGAMVAGPAEAT